jgi:hypothetical protein
MGKENVDGFGEQERNRVRRKVLHIPSITLSNNEKGLHGRR